VNETNERVLNDQGKTEKEKGENETTKENEKRNETKREDVYACVSVDVHENKRRV